MKLKENFYFYPGRKGCSNTFIIRTEERMIIIDLGARRDLRKLGCAMKKDGLNLEEINEIWLTHAHPDHCQSVVDLMKAVKKPSKVRAARIAKEILTSPDPLKTLVREQIEILDSLNVRPIRPYLKTTSFSFYRHLRSLYGKWLPVEKVVELRAGKTKDGIEIIPLPGHTESHLGFLYQRILISGDLFTYWWPFVHQNSCDASLTCASQSLRKILRRKKEIDLICPCHGGPICDFSVLEYTLGWTRIFLGLGKKEFYRKRELTFSDMKRIWTRLNSFPYLSALERLILIVVIYKDTRGKIGTR